MHYARRFPSPIVCAFALLAAVTSCQKPSVRDALLQPAQLRGAVTPAPKFVLQSREVTVDFARLQDPATQRLRIPTFGDEVLDVVRDRQEAVGKGAFIWHGHIDKELGSTVILAVKGEVLIGNITTQSGKVYQIRYLDRGIHRLQQVDLAKLPPEKDPEAPRIQPRPEADTCSTDPNSDIDVLVVYTDDARAGAGGTDAIEATVYLALYETNQSYVNSNVNQRLRLAHMEEVSYTESGVSSTDKAHLQNSSDGVLDNVHTLRNTYAADLVAMLTESLDFCGESYIMTSVSNAFEAYGFAVVKRDCATGNYSFGHELGHAMGARHDWPSDPTNNSPYAYNHGHYETSPADTTVPPWRTIMAYNNSACAGTASKNCIRLMYWSNPFINYPPGGTSTDPMGTSTGSQQTDNHQTLNNTALTVANFRCSSPGVSNVWMKDTWNDSGKEPDPNTASEDMWKSPYIWVRHSQDTALVHQHEHENPELGSTNWVYAKLHNGSTAPASGNLQTYWANASTSLAWPAGWTLIGSVSVTGFAASSTRVVEQKWTNLPGEGHYCLLARWVSSADPMAVAEGPDINVNVRNNNNLIWRNVEIKDLTTDAAQDAWFILRNPTREPLPSSLWIRGPRSGRQPSFLPTGEVSVRFDERLQSLWKQGGTKGTGYKPDDYGLRVSASEARIDNLILPPRFEGRVFIRMRRLPSTPRRDFGLDIVHLALGPQRPEAAGTLPRERVIGGVSYEIHTDHINK
jgi:hypothetical protein